MKQAAPTTWRNWQQCCWLLLLAPLCLGQVPPPPARTTLPEDALSKVRFDQQLGAQAPLDLTFRDEQGQSVQLGSFFGERPVLLVLAYYRCPMLCTLVLEGAANALGQVPFVPGEDYQVVVVSIDSRDTPEQARQAKATVLEHYGRVDAANGWHFLIGDEKPIQTLADAVGFGFVYEQNSDQFAHPAGLVMLTPKGVISRYFFGMTFAPRDLRLGLVEASNNQIGGPVEQLLLRCFHYDPLTGRYGLYINVVLRVAGVLTVLLLAGLIVGLLRRERQRQAAAVGAAEAGGASPAADLPP